MIGRAHAHPAAQPSRPAARRPRASAGERDRLGVNVNRNSEGKKAWPDSKGILRATLDQGATEMPKTNISSNGCLFACGSHASRMPRREALNAGSVVSRLEFSRWLRAPCRPGWSSLSGLRDPLHPLAASASCFLLLRPAPRVSPRLASRVLETARLASRVLETARPGASCRPFRIGSAMLPLSLLPVQIRRSESSLFGVLVRLSPVFRVASRWRCSGVTTGMPVRVARGSNRRNLHGDGLLPVNDPFVAIVRALTSEASRPHRPSQARTIAAGVFPDRHTRRRPPIGRR